jgi:RNA polymerase sigma factor (sigma-70 family)
MNEDAELLRRYAEEGANDAFAELVQRHVDLVYSAALRQLNGDAHLAADATQLVFTDLARKAPTLVRHRVLAGWLFTSTRYATAKLVRGERRRHAREREAQLMHETSHDDSTVQLDWQRVRPVLDDVIGELGDRDREVILLRFFEGRDYADVGAKLVDFVVDTNGDVKDARAIRSSQQEFEAAAVQAVSKWKFKPGKKGGRDVLTHMQVPIVFTLAGQKTPSRELPPATTDAPEGGPSDASSTVNLTRFHVVGSAPNPAASPSLPTRE